MLKIASMIVALASISTVYADCEISESLINKECSSDYYMAKNSRQLNEYLNLGKFKDGKLLNLEIAFNLKEKEINLGTTCDLRFKIGADIRTSQNGICLQAKNLFIKKDNNLIAEKKAPINLIANNSITIRRANIQTTGDVNISTKSFDPFTNEVLISKHSKIYADKININTPSSLIINKDSRIKSSDIVLNGGNCEVGDNDDQENDDSRDRERHCRKFKPILTYSGSCLNNPIPITLKISSIADINDSLKLTYSVPQAPIGSSIKWKFDDRIESSNTNVIQSFIFPGKHLTEVVVSNSSGYFRKLGLYNNIAPTRFNKGQLAIFQFSGLHKNPAKVIGTIGFKKFTLVRSEQDPHIYSGEILADKSGKSLITIPEFGYSANFNIFDLPSIVNPHEYVNSFIDSINSSIEELGQDGLQGTQLASSLSIILNELKTKINSLPEKDQAALAIKLQANSTGLSNMVTKSETLNFKFNLLNLLIPTANALSITLADRFIPQKLKEYTVSDIIEVGAGVSSVTIGFLILKSPGTFYSIDKIAGIGLIAFGVSTIIMYHQKKNKLINDLYDFIGNQVSLDAAAGEAHTIRLTGTFVPVSSNSKSILIQNSRSITNEFNNSVAPINKSLSSINSLMSSLGITSKLVGNIPTLSFPTNSFQSSLSSEFISNVQLINSQYGDVSLKSVNKIESGVSVQFNTNKSQNATIRVFYKNDDFNVYVYKDIVIKISLAPKAVINYKKTNLQVDFDSTDQQNPDITGLAYSWNFGDGQTSTEKSPTHTYSKAGTYPVSLTVTDTTGSQASTSVDINVTKIEGNVTFCNISNNNGTMYFLANNSEEFILNRTEDTCECHTFSLPQGQYSPIYGFFEDESGEFESLDYYDSIFGEESTYYFRGGIRYISLAITKIPSDSVDRYKNSCKNIIYK